MIKLLKKNIFINFKISCYIILKIIIIILIIVYINIIICEKDFSFQIFQCYLNYFGKNIILIVIIPDITKALS
jgi:hypothetical protein